MTIKRYDIHDDGVYVSMEPRETGRFVKHDDHLAALRREREPVEPVAWLTAHKPTGAFYTCREASRENDYWALPFPVYTIPPDHLALVAAAYRDAAGVLDDPGDKAAVDALGRQLCCSGHDCGCRGADVGVYLQHLIRQQTPADAEAHLTALLRAEYERGVRDAADAVPVDQYHESWMARMLVCARVRILALLTQEGR